MQPARDSSDDCSETDDRKQIGRPLFSPFNASSRTLEKRATVRGIGGKKTHPLRFQREQHPLGRAPRNFGRGPHWILQPRASLFPRVSSDGRRPHPRILNLIEHGVEVWFRPTPYPLRKRAWRALIAPQKSPTTLEVERLVAARSPDFVVISDGAPFPPLDLLEMCATKRLPFAIIVHCNQYFWWPADDLAERYRAALAAALRCYFVSDANRRIAEKQIGCELPNAEIVRNPFNVDFNASPPWPPLGRDGELRFACVGRLDATGQRPGYSLRSAGGTSLGDAQLAITLVWRRGEPGWPGTLGATPWAQPIESCSRAMWRT